MPLLITTFLLTSLLGQMAAAANSLVARLTYNANEPAPGCAGAQLNSRSNSLEQGRNGIRPLVEWARRCVDFR
jgi:hypothetical protein